MNIENIRKKIVDDETVMILEIDEHDLDGISITQQQYNEIRDFAIKIKWESPEGRH